MAHTAARAIDTSCWVLTWCTEDGSLKGSWLQSRRPRAVTCSVNSLATLGAQKSRGLSLQVLAFQKEQPEGRPACCAQGGDGWLRKEAVRQQSSMLQKTRQGLGGSGTEQDTFSPLKQPKQLTCSAELGPACRPRGPWPAERPGAARCHWDNTPQDGCCL